MCYSQSDTKISPISWTLSNDLFNGVKYFDVYWVHSGSCKFYLESVYFTF